MEKTRDSANCPYCLSPIEDSAEKVRCPVCGVAHHAECWRMNGKCSVYGCDGWQAWSSEIADKIAPKIKGDIDLDATGTERTSTATYAGPLCIECGAPVKPGKLVCGNCRKIARPRFMENCSGPALIVLALVGAVIMLIVKGLC